MHQATIYFSLFIYLNFVYSAFIPRDGDNTCGYQSCRKSDPDKLNIHIVPHSHDDVGWLKTVDQYYFGTHPLIQKAGVRYIINSYLEALQKNPDRRFIQVETAFFWHWWKRQNDDTKNIYRNLVNSGRLEIIGGGWAMPDEATTHYHSLIDQYTWGFRRLNDSLGKCGRPKIGWQIDPFGHSREQAAMFAQFGFDGYFFGRLDWTDKNNRLAKKNAEFIWNGNPSLGNKGDIFTGILYNNYSPPPGYCFDFLCADEPIIDDTSSSEYNVPKRIDDYLVYAKRQSAHYRTNNVLMTMGNDFTYQFAEMNFKNLDLLIRYTNERNGSEYNMFYSTPSCYLKALNDENLKWPAKTDDFFPYASDPHSYWTGYYTSRPTLKYFERLGNNYLQVIKQMASVKYDNENEKYLEELREAMGNMQHHDAVTGTEKEHVAADYAKILHKAMVNNEPILTNTLRMLTTKRAENNLQFESCLLLNISSCEITETNNDFVTTVYNLLGQKVSQYVRLPVTGTNYIVRDYSGRIITNQIVPIANQIQNLPGRSSSATYELLFKADDIPALGFKSYHIISEKSVEKITLNQLTEFPGTINSPNKNVKVRVDESKKLSIKFSNSEDIVVFPSVMFYEAATGNNMVFENRSSGAYIFRPKVEHPEYFNDSASRVFYTDGALVSEIHVQLNDWITELYRVYSDSNIIEYNWIVGPIPIEDGIGKEVIVRYKSTIGNTKGIVYTDSNGRQIIRRQRRYGNVSENCTNENCTVLEPVAANYYPVTNKIFLQNDETKQRFTVLTDRSQGGSSLNDGELELMIHRRLLKDDAFGVEEALNETAFGKGLVATGKHYLNFGNFEENPQFIIEEKLQTIQLSLQPWLTFTPLNDTSFDEYQNKNKMLYSGLRKPLPENVNILTLEPWKDGTILLRLEHLYEAGESNTMSHPVEINITDLFSAFDIISVEEMTLGANQPLEELSRLKWESEVENILQRERTESITLNDVAFNVTLRPSEIRTFIAHVNYK